MEGRFEKAARRGAVWDELAEEISAEGVKRDGKQCREKWDKLMAELKEVSEGKRDRRESPYFGELLGLVDIDHSVVFMTIILFRSLSEASEVRALRGCHRFGLRRHSSRPMR
ncbi:trihelix transcription factor GTL1-like protein [Cinnamomum micranthum f. kanehirae]|uniref:Trihelix transcription factor GTL1-like protein n=1 Tax=Cinnamomum micranthum f. kanehirae TaxID=337451 RepID=A0A3S3NAD4_9MAGN|nr:trihelix transcription factor GTL1-like protein [Cinnamomum micranthum f. kanehirae]